MVACVIEGTAHSIFEINASTQRTKYGHGITLHNRHTESGDAQSIRYQAFFVCVLRFQNYEEYSCEF